MLHNFIVSSRSFQIENAAAANHESPVNIAFKHHYLLHSILGLSALQLYAEDRSDIRRYSQATAHQDAAIRMARPHVVNLTAEHAEAIFWFSSFTSMFSLAEPIVRPHSPELKRDWVAEWLDSLALSRGITTVLRQMPDSSDVKKATAPENWHDGREEVEVASVGLRDSYPQLAKVEAFIHSHCGQQDQLNVCLAVTEKLFSYISALQKDLSNKKNIHLVQVWSMRLPDVFVQMCHDKHVVAMVILAHYGVALYSRKFVWFFRGWPFLFMQECERIIHENGIAANDLLKWPSEIIRKD